MDVSACPSWKRSWCTVVKQVVCGWFGLFWGHSTDYWIWTGLGASLHNYCSNRDLAHLSHFKSDDSATVYIGSVPIILFKTSVLTFPKPEILKHRIYRTPTPICFFPVVSVRPLSYLDQYAWKYYTMCWWIKDVSLYDPQAYGPHTFFTTGFPRFLSIRGARGLQAFDLPLHTNY
jgi:hypothetical protein